MRRTLAWTLEYSNIQTTLGRSNVEDGGGNKTGRLYDLREILVLDDFTGAPSIEWADEWAGACSKRFVFLR